MAATEGMLHFIDRQDAVACCVLMALASMSVASWTVFIAKLWQHFALRHANEALLARLAGADDIESWQRLAASTPRESLIARLVLTGTAACSQLRTGGQGSFPLASADDHVSMAIQGALDEAAAQRENAVVVLATVGATAPFVGLFGTVWSIYQALENIGITGQGTMDKVAGPVGEALIMTACGLAVAIPAVWGHNILIRINRVWQGGMEQFARRLFGLLATGRLPQAAPEAAGTRSVRPVLKEA